MGCTNIICGKQSYDYSKQQRLLQKCLIDISQLNRCYSHDFVSKCYKNLILNPQQYIMKYDKKLQPKQVVAYTVFEKWKLILYGTNIDNPNYVDCIGFDKQLEEERIAEKTYRFSKRNPFEIRLQDLYFHESYRQIEKDSGRVYLVPQIKQEQFEKLLKKIANHFPQSGYSLGINYIVGYFLLVGMSQMDSFWMFIHLALNQKYLALGFFEDDLPLMKVVVEIFKNILRRKNKQLYNQIYKNLEVDDTSWILKWVTSFFLSTFPIEFCHYVFDYVLTFGILGLSVVSFGIVNFFQNLIFRCEQSTDFLQLFQQLLNFKYLSHSVPIGQFMSSIYDVTLQQRDFDLLGQLGDNFYVQYFILYAEWKFKGNKQCREKMDELLSQWYQQNKIKRQNFAKMAQTYQQRFFEPNNSSQKDDDQNKSFTNTNMQMTKEQKFEQKSIEQPQVVFHNVQGLSMKVPQQMRLSYLQNVNTIKVSSQNKKVSHHHQQQQQSSSQVQNDQKSSAQQSFYHPLDYIAQTHKLKSEQHIKKNSLMNLRTIKSMDDRLQLQNKWKQKGELKQRSERFSMKSFSYLEKESQSSIIFNEKPLRDGVFSKRVNLTQTLRMRRQGDDIGVQVVMGQKAMNSSSNLTLFLNTLSKNDLKSVQINHKHQHQHQHIHQHQHQYQPKQQDNKNGQQQQLKLQDFDSYKNSVQQQQSHQQQQEVQIQEKVEVEICYQKEIEDIFFKPQQQAIEVSEHTVDNKLVVDHSLTIQQPTKSQPHSNKQSLSLPIIIIHQDHNQMQQSVIINGHNQKLQIEDYQIKNDTILQDQDNKIVTLSFSSAIMDDKHEDNA